MMHKFFAGLWIAVALAVGTCGLAFAHGHTLAGDYDIVIGFHSEPVIQGLPNSLDLFVTNTKTNEKVNGLEDTLQAEIIFGSSKKILPLVPQEGRDGAYTADLIPTQAGKYTWHIFGKINAQTVDVSMTSGSDTFGEVEPQSTYAFPGARSFGGDSGITAWIALAVGILGVVLGLAGLVVGSRRAKL